MLQPARMLCIGQNTLSPDVIRTMIPQTRLSLLFDGYGDSPGVKRIGREDEHSPASIAEVKNPHPLRNALTELPKRIFGSETK